MSKISDIQKIREFKDYNGVTYGVYTLLFNGRLQVFIRNGDSIGSVIHYSDRPSSECVSEIRDDVKKEFFMCLDNM